MVNRYRDYSTYLRGIFGERVQKISLDAGMTCPNRDGTLSVGGCLFCDGRGSGTGAMRERGESLWEQIVSGIQAAEKRYGAHKFIAYFQSFSNTYAPPDQLRLLYAQAISHRSVVGLSVGTRPDCVNPEVVGILSSYRRDYLVWLELGLQSAHDETLRRIRRGHDVAAFEKAVRLAAGHGLNICAHVILGLPGEDRSMMHETARYLGELPVHGVKIHLLYVVRGTPLADLYERKEIRCLERGEYVDLAVDFLERLPPEVVIQRLTGEPSGADLVAPRWAMEKAENLRLIRERLEERDTWQGKKYRKNHRPSIAVSAGTIN